MNMKMGKRKEDGKLCQNINQKNNMNLEIIKNIV